MFDAQFKRIGEYNWLTKKFSDAVKKLYPHPIAVVTQQFYEPSLLSDFVILTDTTIDVVTGEPVNAHDTKYSCTIVSYPIRAIQKIHVEFAETPLIPDKGYDLNAVNQKVTITVDTGQAIVIDYLHVPAYYLQSLSKELEHFTRELKARM
ncbi:hypothetical protein ACI7RC_01475 [Brevibacillus sp. B_LB10_24]|uniref:hypothetical protein n=1 Tax=Brevibacillus sp. B_LB10_24 TaxID=3380645 RepID=UPI0038B8DF49